jgi:hypothetical protein
MYCGLKNHYGHTRWNSLVTWVLWNFILVCLETVLVPVQDMCTVCAKRTIGSKIILDTPDGTPRFEAQLEPRFGSFGDSANLDAR